MPELAKWDSFYGIVGSAAGALIGLQFVVMTLIAQTPRRAADAGAAFGTPTIVHFSIVLLLAALLRTPWETAISTAAAWGLAGFSGFIYQVLVTWRIRKQASYKPVFEDWLFHVVLPLAAYIILTASPFAAPSNPREALFAVGGASLLLLFTGIHNAWDAVAYHVFVPRPDGNETEKEKT